MPSDPAKVEPSPREALLAEAIRAADFYAGYEGVGCKGHRLALALEVLLNAMPCYVGGFYSDTREREEEAQRAALSILRGSR
jgi:hypothetical protein